MVAEQAGKPGHRGW